MKKTKERILSTALSLFNERGIASVTLRTIAQEMGISQGNLNYHFKKRDDILEALYLQLVAKMDAGIATMQATEINLQLFFDLSKIMMTQFYEYRFFMLDFVQIMRNNQVINQHYTQLTQLREIQFLGLFQLWVEANFMRPETFENEYKNLYVRMNILGDFWLSTAFIQQDLSKETIDKYAMIIFENIYPYLTTKGQKAFKDLSSKT